MFRSVLAVEKDPAAHRTLALRAFFRRFDAGEVPGAYYRYVSGQADRPWDLTCEAEWREAQRHTLCCALGSEAGNQEVSERLNTAGLKERDWVLIGGPPCQAYSLVGRARNAGNKDYRPEDDERHFLYREYLDVLDKYRPAVFVLENVKGVMSSRVGGERIFHRLLEDLCSPGASLTGRRRRRVEYAIRAVASPYVYFPGQPLHEVNPSEFVVRSETLGIPQARHRVILLGVRADLSPCLDDVIGPLVPGPVSCATVLDALPALRSGLSRTTDDADVWARTVVDQARKLALALKGNGQGDVADSLDASVLSRIDDMPTERTSRLRPGRGDLSGHPLLKNWFRDPRLEGVLNHETRSHMESDLQRYVFCATFALARGRSPTREDFPESLAPDHRSWGSGGFADRFRVQVANEPATTITSHIAKDGHYFIHYDPAQCRSLTVREAARLQTFPDNYFFMGHRTEQYVQVGNAVPPLLAREVGGLVANILRG